MEYPTRNGVPIPTSEVLLSPTELNPDDPKSFNNHHIFWTAKHFGRFLLLKTLRDLESSQETMFYDQHSELHRIYDPPIPPNFTQAMDIVSEAYDNDENMKVWDLHQRKYVIQKISPVWMKQVKIEFDNNK